MSDVQVDKPLSRPHRWFRPRGASSRSPVAATRDAEPALAPDDPRPVPLPRPPAPPANRLDEPRLTLQRLTRLTRLTPPQVLVIGADLLGELAELHADGQALGGFGAERVELDRTGQARFAGQLDAPGGAPGGAVRAAVRADLASAHALLVDLVRSTAGRASPGPATAPEGAAAASTALRALASVTGVVDLDHDLAERAAALRGAADAVGRLARRELAALVHAATGTAPDLATTGRHSPAPRGAQLGKPGTNGSSATGRPEAGPPPRPVPVILDRDGVLAGPPAVPPPRLTPPTLPAAGNPAKPPAGASRASTPSDPETPRAQPRRRGGRLAPLGWLVVARAGRWVLLLIVVVVLLAAELLVLHNRIKTDVAALRSAGQSNPSATAKASPPEVRLGPPAAAGPITEVSLRPLDRCTPGTPCQVRVLVRLRPPKPTTPAAGPQPAAPTAQPAAPAAAPQPVGQTVRWVFRVTDLCTRASHDLPGGSVTVPPGGTEVTAVNVVTLPAGKALQVNAVTTDPAQAASDALPVPASPTC